MSWRTRAIALSTIAAAPKSLPFGAIGYGISIGACLPVGRFGAEVSSDAADMKSSRNQRPSLQHITDFSYFESESSPFLS